MLYRQITFAERYTLGLLRRRGCSAAAIARVLGRHRSTIGREVQRNRAHSDGTYRPQLADWYARTRRGHSRRNRQFTPAQWARIQVLLHEDWSPEQVAGWLRRHDELAISHETIYRHIWTDKQASGTLHRHLHGARKQRRKRYGRYDSRGRLAGKRAITERPTIVATGAELGHWEADTMLGAGHAGPCVFSMVERKSGYLLLGQLDQRTSAFVNARARQLIATQPQPVQPSPSTMAPSSTNTPNSSARRARASTLPHRITPGSGAPTKTPTAWSGSTSPSARAWPTSPNTTAIGSLRN